MTQTIPTSTQRATVEVSEHDREDPPVNVQNERNRRVPHVNANDDVEIESTQGSHYLNLRREFNALKPDFFDGSKGPSFADTWLDSVEEEMDILRIPLSYRVSIAVGRLADRARARAWWRATKSLHGDEALVWSNFRKLFLGEYVSKAYREDKCKELDRLQQGSMTVEEYRLKFEELCVYKDSFLTHPEDKMNKFIDGLRYNLQPLLTIGKHESYKDLVEDALRLDSRFRLTEPLRGDQKSKKRMHEQSSSHLNTQAKASNANTDLQAQSINDRKRSRFVDDRLVILPSSAPSREGVTCYKCGEPGHLRRNCPTADRPYKPHGTGRGGGRETSFASGANLIPLGQGRGDGSRRASTSNPQAQGSSQPGRVYALTNEDRTPCGAPQSHREIKTQMEPRNVTVSLIEWT